MPATSHTRRVAAHLEAQVTEVADLVFAIAVGPMRSTASSSWRSPSTAGR